MKNFQNILVLTLLFFLIACNKEGIVPIEPGPPTQPPIYVPVFEPGDTSKGAAYANKLTAFWRAEAFCKQSLFDSTKLYVAFFTYTKDGSTRETGGFAYFSKNSLGNYTITTSTSGIDQLPLGIVSATYNTWSSDGDVSEDFYKVDSTDQKNGLTINKIDLVNKRVEGAFHVSYNLQEPRLNPQNPKKVTFSEGRFWATIRD